MQEPPHVSHKLQPDRLIETQFMAKISEAFGRNPMFTRAHFHRIARTMGFDIPDEPGPDAGTSVTYAEFLDAVDRMREVGFPIERDPAEAWPDFVGWRVNYEPAAYAVAAAVYAVPALWSGARRHPMLPIPPLRPGRGHPPK